jgi:hypothetical protein
MGLAAFWTKPERSLTTEYSTRVTLGTKVQLDCRLGIPPKIKREARARRLHLPGWVGFVAGCPAEVFGLPHQDLSSKPAFKPVPRMPDDYHAGKAMSTLIILISGYRAGALFRHPGAFDFGIDLASD